MKFCYLFIFTVLFSFGLQGETYRLFKKERSEQYNLPTPKKNYNETVKLISAGDSIQFSNNQSFKVVKFLGQGFTSKIFEIEDGKVIRIAKETRYIRFISEYLKGHQGLIDSEIPIVKVYPEISSSFEYVIAEKVEGELNLSRFIYKHHEFQESLGKVKYDLMVEELKNFMLSTHQFEAIDDFKAEQLIWDTANEKWILLDWLQHIVRFSQEESDRFAIEVDDFLTPVAKILSKHDIATIKSRLIEKTGIGQAQFDKNSCARLATTFINGFKAVSYP